MTATTLSAPVISRPAASPDKGGLAQVTSRLRTWPS